MRTPYDQAALTAERSRNKSDAKDLRRARRRWMEQRHIISCHWIEGLPQDGTYVSRMEGGQATRLSQIIARGRRDL